MKYIVQTYILIALMPISILMVSANQLPASEAFSDTYINQNLAKQFPIEKRYGQVMARFSDPKVDINVLDKTVEISVQITSIYAQQSLTAKGILVGQLEYYEFDETVVFKRPILEHFYLESDNMTDSLPALRVIKQSMSHNFRDLKLIELKSYGLESQMTAPSEIEISLDKIIVHWNASD